MRWWCCYGNAGILTDRTCAGDVAMAMPVYSLTVTCAGGVAMAMLVDSLTVTCAGDVAMASGLRV